MAQAPADRAEQPLTQEQEATDPQQGRGHDGDAERQPGLSAKDLDLAQDVVELGAQQRDVCLEKEHERFTRLLELVQQAVLIFALGLLARCHVLMMTYAAGNWLELIRAAVSKKP